MCTSQLRKYSLENCSLFLMELIGYGCNGVKDLGPTSSPATYEQVTKSASLGLANFIYKRKSTLSTLLGCG